MPSSASVSQVARLPVRCSQAVSWKPRATVRSLAVLLQNSEPGLQAHSLSSGKGQALEKCWQLLSWGDSPGVRVTPSGVLWLVGGPGGRGLVLASLPQARVSHPRLGAQSRASLQATARSAHPVPWHRPPPPHSHCSRLTSNACASLSISPCHSHTRM